MKNKILIIVSSILFVIFSTLSIIGYIEHNKDNKSNSNDDTTVVDNEKNNNIEDETNNNDNNMDDEKNDEENNNVEEDIIKEEKPSCTYNGELKQGVEYVGGQYTYRYMQEGKYSDEYVNEWKDTSFDGWGVILTDKESARPVTSELCSSINGKPIVSMSHMLSHSQSTFLDLSSFDTSDVTDMRCMFCYS